MCAIMYSPHLPVNRDRHLSNKQENNTKDLQTIVYTMIYLNDTHYTFNIYLQWLPMEENG